MIIPQDYALGIDVWEGSLDIDEPLLKENGVEFAMIRINDTAGNLHNDANFAAQWEQAKNLKRGAYFVVGDWFTLAAQVDFLNKNLPADCELLALDVELHYVLTPGAYATLLNGLIVAMQQKGLSVVIYTGGGYTSIVNPWPKDVNYWWARYPSALYPSTSIEITWDVLRGKLALLDWTPGTAPGPVTMWQCSGDRFKLPGCAGRAMDINVMPRAQFLKYWPVAIEPPPPPPPDDDPLEDRVAFLEAGLANLTAKLASLEGKESGDIKQITDRLNAMGLQLDTDTNSITRLINWAQSFK